MKDEPKRDADRAGVLLGLFDETVLLFHRLTVEAGRIHGQGSLTAALRGVLRGLQRYGPQTVPAMARRRPVSRQHIQLLVNRLLAAKLVELQENPAHKRSQLVVLTTKGHRKIEDMDAWERRLLRRLQTGLSIRDMERAGAALRSVRTALEGRSWQQLRKQK